MALIPCPECQREVSAQALACPQCAFPFPGKQALSKGSQSNKLGPCPDCGFLVSNLAQKCPHCGVALMGEQGPISKNGHAVEETWLCPHCGTSYTRKVQKKEEKLMVGHQVPPAITEDRNMAGSQGLAPHQFKGKEVPEPLRKQSPLWQDSTLPTKKDFDVISRRYPRSRKKSIIVGFIIFVLVAVSIGLGALWQFQGINPLEALVYWRM